MTSFRFNMLPSKYCVGPSKWQLTALDWIFRPFESYRLYSGIDKPALDTLITDVYGGGRWEFYSKSEKLSEALVELYASIGKIWSDEMMFMFERSDFYEHSRHLGFQDWACMATRVQVGENGKITVLPWKDEWEIV